LGHKVRQGDREERTNETKQEKEKPSPKYHKRNLLPHAKRDVVKTGKKTTQQKTMRKGKFGFRGGNNGFKKEVFVGTQRGASSSVLRQVFRGR